MAVTKTTKSVKTSKRKIVAKSKTADRSGKVISSGKRQSAARPAKGLLFAAVVGVVLVVGGTFGYAQYRAMQPEGVLKQALARSLQADSAGVDFRMVDSSQGQPDGVWKMTGTVVNQGQFDLTGSYQKASRTVGLDIKSVDGSDAYLRLQGLAGLSELLGNDAALYGITPQRNPITGLENRWLVIPADIKNTVIQNRPVSGSSSLALSADDKNTLARLYGRSEFLKISKTLADDSVDGVASYHYQVAADSVALEAFLKLVQKDIERLKLTDEQIDSLASTIASVSPFDVWVSKDDKRFNKLAYTSSNSSGADAVELKLNQYNESVTIDRPAQSTPLLEALTGLNL